MISEKGEQDTQASEVLFLEHGNYYFSLESQLAIGGGSMSYTVVVLSWQAELRRLPVDSLTSCNYLKLLLSQGTFYVHTTYIRTDTQICVRYIMVHDLEL